MLGATLGSGTVTGDRGVEPFSPGNTLHGLLCSLKPG